MDRDGTETGVEICFTCEPNGSDGCRRENPLHALCSAAPRPSPSRVWHHSEGRDSIGPVLPFTDYCTNAEIEKMHFIKK